ncbi:hypothetical protein GCM10010451_55820 [Streptomyces virens]|uniref:Uncharacterized protein n=1 Tax=Streptomyces virens TaxID=285572 RepID=A0ABP6PZZ7_9ACTN
MVLRTRTLHIPARAAHPGLRRHPGPVPRLPAAAHPDQRRHPGLCRTYRPTYIPTSAVTLACAAPTGCRTPRPALHTLTSAAQPVIVASSSLISRSPTIAAAAR